jgi:hypothetical protein
MPRCIVQQGSGVEVKAGVLTSQLPEALDLCEDCSALFADWLRSGHQASQAGPVGAIPAPLGKSGGRDGSMRPGASWVAVGLSQTWMMVLMIPNRPARASPRRGGEGEKSILGRRWVGRNGEPRMLSGAEVFLFQPGVVARKGRT